MKQIDKYDPGFIEYLKKFASPEERSNWRTLYGRWLDYQRYLRLLRNEWMAKS